MGNARSGILQIALTVWKTSASPAIRLQWKEPSHLALAATSVVCHAEMFVQIHAREVSQRIFIAAKQNPATGQHLLMAPGAQERHGAAVDEASGREMREQRFPL